MHTKIYSLVFASLVLSGPAAETYYVDNVRGNESYDGLSARWEGGTRGPLVKIQSAIDRASAGDTVSVAAGTYGDEQGSVERTDDCHAYRIRISKSITLVAPSGREKTVIEGAFGAQANQTGKDARAAIVIDAAAAQTKIVGFTLRKCSESQTATYANLSGSAVLFLGDYGGLSAQPWIVDCAVEDCQSYRGALYRVNVARTFVRECRTYDSCSGANQCNLIHCVFYRNSDGDGSSFKVNPVVYGGDYVVNCSFVRNKTAVTASGDNAPKNFFNCVVAESDDNSNVRATTVRNLVIHEASGCITATTKENIQASRRFQLAAPILGDFRPMTPVANVSATAVAATAGSAALLADLPEEYRWTDVNGTPFSANGNVIAAGAVQTPMTPVAGFATTNTVVNGVSPIMSLSKKRYQVGVFTDEWPKTYELSNDLSNPDDLYYYVLSGSGNFLVPDSNGEALYVPQNGIKVDDLVARAATAIKYVAKSGSDSNDGSSAHPYLTIQAAVDSFPNDRSVYGIVRVGRGTYADEGKVGSASDDSIMNCVAVNQSNARISIRSEEGPDVTFIKGRKSAGGSDGLGADAMRCVRLTSADQTVRGFTLLDGHCGGDGTSWQDRCGGAVNGAASKTFISDCVISNCCGYNVGAAYNCSLLRCRLFSNKSVNGSLISSARAVNSVFCDNRAKSLVFDAGVCAVNCTVYEPTDQGVLPSAHEYFVNMIIGRASNANPSASQKNLAGCVFDGFTYNWSQGPNRPDVDFVMAAPCFADAASRDFRLATGSAAFGNPISAWKGAGPNWTADLLYANYYAYVARDIEGNAPFFVDGRPTIGAYFRPAKQSLCLSADPKLEISSSPAESAVDFGTEVTVTASAADDRPLVGLEVNGEFKPGVSAWKFTASDDHFVAAYSVKAVSPKPMVWYVDANKAVDTGNGWSEETAFKLLSTAMSHALDGDTVCALPGTYAEGSMLQTVKLTDDPVLRSRVVVPPGVTLCSRDGAEATVIRGELGSGTVGLGEGAMRCAFVNAHASLRGFTLTGGRTLFKGYSASDNDNERGGGVLTAEDTAKLPGGTYATSVIEDCIISNNAAVAGGGASNGSYRRCRFFENIGLAGSSAVAKPSRFSTCVVDRNRGTEAVGDPREVEGCTIGASNVTTDYKSTPSIVCDPGSSVWTVRNCLFLGGGASRIRYAYSCAMPEGWSLTSNQPNPVREDMRPGDVSVDAAYVPAVDSVACDALESVAEEAFSPDADVYGGQRIYNGNLDIGAVERDWRPVYASDIARRMSVDRATPGVVESSSKTVLVSADESIVARWLGARSGESVSYELKFRLAADSAAKIVVNGVETAYSEAGEHTLVFDSSLPESIVSVAATKGSVEMLESFRRLGMAVIVR